MVPAAALAVMVMAAAALVVIVIVGGFALSERPIEPGSIAFGLVGIKQADSLSAQSRSANSTE